MQARHRRKFDLTWSQHTACAQSTTSLEIFGAGYSTESHAARRPSNLLHSQQVSVQTTAHILGQERKGSSALVFYSCMPLRKTTSQDESLRRQPKDAAKMGTKSSIPMNRIMVMLSYIPGHCLVSDVKEISLISYSPRYTCTATMKAR